MKSKYNYLSDDTKSNIIKFGNDEHISELLNRHHLTDKNKFDIIKRGRSEKNLKKLFDIPKKEIDKILIGDNIPGSYEHYVRAQICREAVEDCINEHPEKEKELHEVHDKIYNHLIEHFKLKDSVHPDHDISDIIFDSKHHSHKRTYEKILEPKKKINSHGT